MPEAEQQICPASFLHSVPPMRGRGLVHRKGDLMRKVLFVFALLLIPASLFAQDWRRGYRNRPYADNFFELSPFLGYRYGGTIYADQTALFNQDVAVDSAANFGVNFAIPVPLAYHTFGGWKRSGFGDLNQHGPDSVRFYTKTKTVTQRWPTGTKAGAEFVIPTMK